MCVFTIFQAQGTRVVKPLHSVLASEGSFPRVAEGGGRSLHDALWGPHVVRQHHVEVPTQPSRQQCQL